MIGHPTLDRRLIDLLIQDPSSMDRIQDLRSIDQMILELCMKVTENIFQTAVDHLLKDFLRIKGLHLTENSIFRKGNPLGGNHPRHKMKRDLDHLLTKDLRLKTIWIGLIMTLGQGKDCSDLGLQVQDLKDCLKTTHLSVHQEVLECNRLFDMDRGPHLMVMTALMKDEDQPDLVFEEWSIEDQDHHSSDQGCMSMDLGHI